MRNISQGNLGERQQLVSYFLGHNSLRGPGAYTIINSHKLQLSLKWKELKMSQSRTNCYQTESIKSTASLPYQVIIKHAICSHNKIHFVIPLSGSNAKKRCTRCFPKGNKAARWRWNIWTSITPTSSKIFFIRVCEGHESLQCLYLPQKDACCYSEF